MGIWIRSQCKKWLVSANELWIIGIEIRATHQANGDGYFIMGAYLSDVEAMQVLNDLQQQIEALGYYKCVGKDRDMPCPEFVFQMPEAGFSAEPEKFMPSCASDINHCGLLDDTESGLYEGYFECKAAWDRGCR